MVMVKVRRRQRRLQGGMDTQDVTVTVTNEEETGMVTFWKDGADATMAAVVAGEMITAAVMDPDGNPGDNFPIAMDTTITSATWQWARHADGGSMPAKDSSGWTDISGATSADYTPDATADDGMYLRATATSYDDREGTGKMAAVVSYSAVTANRAPMFPAATATRSVPENSAADRHQRRRVR